MPNEVLKIIADNPSLTEALKEVLLKQFEMDPSEVHEDITNENLGAMLRARLTGIDSVAKAFKEIAKFKSFEKSRQFENPAR